MAVKLDFDSVIKLKSIRITSMVHIHQHLAKTLRLHGVNLSCLIFSKTDKDSKVPHIYLISNYLTLKSYLFVIC